MTPSDYEMIEQGYDPPRMNEGELVYTGPGELAALHAENRRLREALKKIVNRVPWQGRKDFGPGDEGLADYWAWVYHEQFEIARAALAAEPASGEQP